MTFNGIMDDKRAEQVATTYVDIMYKRGFKEAMIGFVWKDKDTSTYNTTVTISDIKCTDENEDGYYVFYVHIKYTRIPTQNATFPFRAEYSLDLPLEELDEWLERNDIDNYNYTSIDDLLNEAQCDLNGHCIGSRCRHWLLCHG